MVCRESVASSGDPAEAVKQKDGAQGPQRSVATQTDEEPEQTIIKMSICSLLPLLTPHPTCSLSLSLSQVNTWLRLEG